MIWLAVRFFRRRSEPQLATAGAPLSREAMQPQPRSAAPVGAMAGGLGAAAAAPAAAQTTPIELTGQDFNDFERLWARSTPPIRTRREGLRERVTDEMFGYFDDDLTANVRKGVVDRVSDVKLLQGDLSEAWTEEGFDYATVAMRFSLINALYERSSGKVVDGSATVPQEVSGVLDLRAQARRPVEALGDPAGRLSLSNTTSERPGRPGRFSLCGFGCRARPIHPIGGLLRSGGLCCPGTTRLGDPPDVGHAPRRRRSRRPDGPHAVAGHPRRPGCTLSAAVERPGSPHLGRTRAARRAAANGIPVTDDAAAAFAAADGVLDFTTPDATMAFAALAARTRIAHIVGTTGLEPSHLASSPRRRATPPSSAPAI